MDPGTIITIVIGGLTSFGFLALLFTVYRSGKKAQEEKQGEYNVDKLQELQVEASKPKSSSTDDRDSMHNGDF